LVVAPVVAVWVDGVAAEVLAGGGVDDVDGVFVDEHEDRCVGVLDAGAEVVKFPGSAQGELAEAVDGVDSDPVVGVVLLWSLGSGRFDGRGVGGGWGVAVGAVGSVVVVEVPEGV
jgi:hypothetical protein